MKISKRIFLTLVSLLLLVAVLTAVGCGESENYRPIKRLSFSQYYKNAIGFDQFESKLQSFYELLQKAYNQSDKEDVRTFEYDKNEYNRLTSSLDYIFASCKENNPLNKENFEEYKALTGAQLAYTQMKTEVAAVQLQISSNLLSKENPEWFDHFEEKLENFHNTFLEEG
jgi:hypothetical protein